MRKVVILSPYPAGTAPSQRFRYEHFLPYFAEKDIQYYYASFLCPHTWKVLYKAGHGFTKVKGIVTGYFRRIAQLRGMQFADYILIHREASPLGPPVFEWFIARVLRKKIIYDFDDAIWLPNTSAQNRWVSWLKWHGKVKWICKWAYKVSCGNAYLADFARKYNNNVFVLPTVVDTEHSHYPRSKPVSTQLTLGWTGSHSTLPYLEPLLPVLQELEKEYDVEVVIIANQNPELPVKNLRYIPWQKESELEDLALIDIGLMPLPDDEWAKGKCGFKAIQYLAMGIPAVASPVGVNPQVVKHGKTGFLADTTPEWLQALRRLIEDKELRQDMGRKGKQHVEDHFSVKATRESFFKLFS